MRFNFAVYEELFPREPKPVKPEPLEDPDDKMTNDIEEVEEKKEVVVDGNGTVSELDSE